MEHITRRAVVFGGLATGATLLASQGSESVRESVSAPEEPKTNTSSMEAKTTEVLAEDTTSQWFNAEVKKEATALAPEAPVALERIAMQNLVREYFVLDHSIPEIIRLNITELILGLTFVESRFAADAVSDQGATGLMQLLPNTRKEHQGEQVYSGVEAIIADIKTAAKLFAQTYQHLKTAGREAIVQVTEGHFGGDEAISNHFFMTPLLVMAYKVGMGNAQSVCRTATKG
jgi:hypothetical protein